MYSEINGKSNLGENLPQGVDISTIHSNFRATSFNVFCHLLNYSQRCIKDLLCQLLLCYIYKIIKSERQYPCEYLLDFWLLLHLMTLLPLKQRQLHSLISSYNKTHNNSCNYLKCGGSSNHFLVLVLYFLHMFQYIQDIFLIYNTT